MSEPITILEQYLQDVTYQGKDGANLRDFMGGNFFSTPVAPSKFKNTNKLIIFSADTGGSHITGATRESTVVFKCYGGTSSYTDARAVREALWQYLHNARGIIVAAGTIALAEETNRFQGPPEPVTGWTVAIARYRITTIQD